MKNIISIDILNDRQKTFDYYHNGISNKPPLISYEDIKNKKLPMSGSESSNFIVIFAMLVGDLIPENDEVWPLYLKMREIMDLILAPRLQKETCNLFRVLVSEFHMMFGELFPNERYTPKSHNFVHYGTVFQFSGPIRNLSTIRFEAKHKNKKKEANATASRRNITHTLCMKEQLSLCYRLMMLKGIESNDSWGEDEFLEHVSLCYDYLLFKYTLPSDFNDACLVIKWIQIHGQTYRKGTCIVIRITDHCYDSLPVFGLIKSILRNEKNRTCLICHILLTSGFDINLHAYVVQRTEQIECVIIDDLLSPFPAIFVSLGKGLEQHKLYVTLRHAL